MTALTLRRYADAREIGRRAIVLSVILWGTLIGTVGFLSVNGRLAGDDYCNASRAASLGVLGAAKSLYMSWHGGWSADLVLSFYGLLVLHLPANVGYLPFALSTMALFVFAGRSAAVALGVPRLPVSRMWTHYVPAAATLLVVGFVALARDQDLIFGVFLWQAASAVHLWPTLLTFILLVGVFEVRHVSGWKVTAGLLAAAIVVAGFNFTETAILAAGATLLAGTFFGRSRLHSVRVMQARLAVRYALIAAVSAACFVAMYLAPGTVARQSALGVPSYSLAQKAGMFDRYVGTLMGDTFGRPALLLACLLGVVVALAVRSRSDLQALAARAALVTFLAGSIGLLGIGLAAAGEVASYPAPWHAFALIPWWLVAAAGTGICLGAVVVTALEGAGAAVLLAPLRALAPTVAVLLSLLVVVQMAGWAGPLTARATTWDSGKAAPIAGLGDREVPYVATCWSSIVDSGFFAAP